MTQPIAPVHSSALADLQNALQLAVFYGSKDIADSDAKQALGRIRVLIAQALAKLGEPNSAAVEGLRKFVAFEPREARDVASVVIYAALTGETGESDWIHSLPCPICDGAAIIQGFPCEACKGTGLSQ
jgi:hypothetical protein